MKLKWKIFLSIMAISMGAAAKTAPSPGARATSSFPPRPGDAIDVIRCPDNYAFKIPMGKKYDFEGNYLRCEDYDKFYELIDKGQMEEAKKLLLTAPK